MSAFLVHEARPGQILHLSQAEGAFTLPGSPATPSPFPLLMITGGSGITPVMCQLRTLLRDGYDGKAGRKVTFLHFARSAQDQIFAEELAAIAAADNDVEVHLRHGEQTFSEFELRRLVPAYRETDTWACGPAGLDRTSSGDAYAGSDRLRVEFFKPPTSTTGTAEGEVSFAASGTQAANTGSEPAGAGRGARAAPGVRLPDGHLLLLHLPQDRRARSATCSPARSPRCPTRTSASA